MILNKAAKGINMLIFSLTVVFGIILDMIMKYIAVTVFKIAELPIIKNVLYFTYLENEGAAFGILKDQRWIFISITILVIIGILVYLIIKKPKNKLFLVSLAMIVSGGIGNLIDRISLGYVIDFIDFRIINFPVFNIADCLVVIGSFLLCIYILRYSEKEV